MSAISANPSILDAGLYVTLEETVIVGVNRKKPVEQAFCSMLLLAADVLFTSLLVNDIAQEKVFPP